MSIFHVAEDFFSMDMSETIGDICAINLYPPSFAHIVFFAIENLVYFPFEIFSCLYQLDIARLLRSCLQMIINGLKTAIAICLFPFQCLVSPSLLIALPCALFHELNGSSFNGREDGCMSLYSTQSGEKRGCH